jgi:glycosyltransferase involved in cell wall biosynthesis
VGSQPVIALVYDDDAYVEAGGAARGLMGRQVAGQSFLDAYLKHGTFSEMAAVVREPESARSLVKTWNNQRRVGEFARTLHVIARDSLYTTMFEGSPPAFVHSPQPPDPALAWLRQQAGPHAFSLTGVTHTLSSAEAVALLQSLVTAPFQPHDALICTSRAVAAMVREVTTAYTEHLLERLGQPARIGLRSVLPAQAIIPLGVDVDRFKPANPEERAEARQTLGVSDDEVAVLYVGRLSHHAKAHPFPIFRATSEAAGASGRSVHLILAGWAAHPAVLDAFQSGARDFAPNVRTSFLDGRDARIRHSVWRAADVFVSPSDSIQETFGLSVVEAMASGLPVVASDWNGYRDLVEDGRTGFLVPTTTVAGATSSATARLLAGELNYDHFLAECSQATAVDIPAMAAAITRLVRDPELRARMGVAGCARARQHFAWEHIIRAYEDLWRTQDQERRRCAQLSETHSRWRGAAGPAAYPSPERSFAAYPTRCLDTVDRVVRVPGARALVDALLAMPLASHAPLRRVSDPALIQKAIALAPCSIADLDRYWRHWGVEEGLGRSTVAWMLKYDLLRPELIDRQADGLPP